MVSEEFIEAARLVNACLVICVVTYISAHLVVAIIRHLAKYIQLKLGYGSLPPLKYSRTTAATISRRHRNQVPEKRVRFHERGRQISRHRLREILFSVAAMKTDVSNSNNKTKKYSKVTAGNNENNHITPHGAGTKFNTQMDNNGEDYANEELVRALFQLRYLSGASSDGDSSGAGGVDSDTAARADLKHQSEAVLIQRTTAANQQTACVDCSGGTNCSHLNGDNSASCSSKTTTITPGNVEDSSTNNNVGSGTRRRVRKRKCRKARCTSESHTPCCTLPSAPGGSLTSCPHHAHHTRQCQHHHHHHQHQQQHLSHRHNIHQQPNPNTNPALSPHIPACQLRVDDVNLHHTPLFATVSLPHHRLGLDCSDAGPCNASITCTAAAAAAPSNGGSGMISSPMMCYTTSGGTLTRSGSGGMGLSGDGLAVSPCSTTSAIHRSMPGASDGRLTRAGGKRIVGSESSCDDLLNTNGRKLHAMEKHRSNRVIKVPTTPLVSGGKRRPKDAPLIIPPPSHVDDNSTHNLRRRKIATRSLKDAMAETCDADMTPRLDEETIADLSGFSLELQSLANTGGGMSPAGLLIVESDSFTDNFSPAPRTTRRRKRLIKKTGANAAGNPTLEPGSPGRSGGGTSTTLGDETMDIDAECERLLASESIHPRCSSISIPTSTTETGYLSQLALRRLQKLSVRQNSDTDNAASLDSPQTDSNRTPSRRCARLATATSADACDTPGTVSMLSDDALVVETNEAGWTQEPESNSSLSTSDSGDVAYTGDEGCQGDDEQSDWFYDPPSSVNPGDSPNAVSMEHSIAGGGDVGAHSSCCRSASLLYPRQHHHHLCHPNTSTMTSYQSHHSPSNDEYMGIPPGGVKAPVAFRCAAAKHYKLCQEQQKQQQQHQDSMLMEDESSCDMKTWDGGGPCGVGSSCFTMHGTSHPISSSLLLPCQAATRSITSPNGSLLPKTAANNNHCCSDTDMSGSACCSTRKRWRRSGSVRRPVRLLHSSGATTSQSGSALGCGVHRRRRSYNSKMNLVAFATSLSKKINRFLEDANEDELEIKHIRKKQRREVLKLATFYQLDVRQIPAKRKSLLLVKQDTTQEMT